MMSDIETPSSDEKCLFFYTSICNKVKCNLLLNGKPRRYLLTISCESELTDNVIMSSRFFCPKMP